MEPQGLIGVHSVRCLGNRRRRKMRNLTGRPWRKTAAPALFAAGAAVPLHAPAAWEPTHTEVYIVPAATVGATRHRLSLYGLNTGEQPVYVQLFAHSDQTPLTTRA